MFLQFLHANVNITRAVSCPELPVPLSLWPAYMESNTIGGEKGSV